jgi:hypothetical protein
MQAGKWINFALRTRPISNITGVLVLAQQFSWKCSNVLGLCKWIFSGRALFDLRFLEGGLHIHLEENHGKIRNTEAACELELERIPTQMTQKPMLRVEVDRGACG